MKNIFDLSQMAIQKRLAALILIIMIVLLLSMTVHADTVEIGIAPPGTELERPSCNELDAVLDAELQDYVWELALNRYPDGGEPIKEYYSSIIGLIDGESEFNPKAYHSNGTSFDRGLLQVNSCWIRTLKDMGYITSSSDLFEPYTNLKCGEWEWWTECYSKTGWAEETYGLYLYGEKHPNNKWTKRVWDKQKGWYSKIWKQ